MPKVNPFSERRTVALMSEIAKRAKPAAARARAGRSRRELRRNISQATVTSTMSITGASTSANDSAEGCSAICGISVLLRISRIDPASTTPSSTTRTRSIGRRGPEG